MIIQDSWPHAFELRRLGQADPITLHNLRQHPEFPVFQVSGQPSGCPRKFSWKGYHVLLECYSLNPTKNKAATAFFPPDYLNTVLLHDLTTNS